MKRFRIIMTSDYVLSEKYLWPDDDGPENPDADDVETWIEDNGGPETIISEWNLPPSLQVIEEKESK